MWENIKGMFSLEHSRRVSVVVEVKDKKELDEVIRRLNAIHGVYYVTRTSGK